MDSSLFFWFLGSLVCWLVGGFVGLLLICLSVKLTDFCMDDPLLR